MTKFRLLRPHIYWSSCPETFLLQNLAREGLKLVVDLTENECVYELPTGVKKISFPIRDFSFRSPESILIRVIEPSLRIIAEEGDLLIHCMGGIGRSGTLAAMYLILLDKLTLEGALNRVRRLGGGPQVPAQLVALKWFERNLEVLGYEKYISLSHTINKCCGDKLDFLSSRINITLDILSEFNLVKSEEDVESLYLCYAASVDQDVEKCLVASKFLEGAQSLVKHIVLISRLVGNVFLGEGVYLGIEKTDQVLRVFLNGFLTNGELIASLNESLKNFSFNDTHIELTEKYDW